jgi:hypothetical protein
VVRIVFHDAVCVADGKGITEIAQYGGSHQCSLCGNRFKIPCLSPASRCSICINTYTIPPPLPIMCNHILLSSTPPSSNGLHDNVDEGDDADFDDEGVHATAQNPDAIAYAEMLKDRYTKAGFPAISVVRERQSFESCKDKASRSKLCEYLQRLDNYSFSDSKHHVPPADLQLQKNLTQPSLHQLMTLWNKKNMIKVTTDDVEGDTVHSIQFDEANVNVNKLGMTICVLLSSSVLGLTAAADAGASSAASGRAVAPAAAAAASPAASTSTTYLSFEAFEDYLQSFSDSETRHGDGSIEDNEQDMSVAEVRFNLLKRMVIALYCRHETAVPSLGVITAGTLQINPLLRDLKRILICFLHLRLRVSEKLIRQFIFAILESNLEKDLKLQRLEALEDFINEKCSAKLSNVKYFHIKREKQKKGGVSVKFNLQGNKLKIIWENISEFIKIGMVDGDTIWGSLVNQANFIELFTLYSGIIRQLSKSHKVAGNVVYDELNDEEIKAYQVDCDLMGGLYINMFGRTHITGYLHWFFDGHGSECLQRYRFIKPFEGQSWEHGMGRSKGVIHNKSNMSGSKGDAGGMIDALMTNNMLTILFLGYVILVPNVVINLYLSLYAPTLT